ncbi:MAG TPA: helix-turn-helix domain-containing protein [Chryseolinea sp.]
MTTPEAPKTIHHGRNLKRLRESLGIKQDALAAQLGEDWHQKRISTLEGKEVIEQELLEQLAKALKVPVDAIKNYDEDAHLSYFNTFNDHSFANIIGPHGTINNPVERWLEALDKNEKLHEEAKRLYEALLKSEREKVALLEKMVK